MSCSSADLPACRRHMHRRIDAPLLSAEIHHKVRPRTWRLQQKHATATCRDPKAAPASRIPISCGVGVLRLTGSMRVCRRAIGAVVGAGYRLYVGRSRDHLPRGHDGSADTQSIRLATAVHRRPVVGARSQLSRTVPSVRELHMTCSRERTLSCAGRAHFT
jgi:hypothetical protein